MARDMVGFKGYRWGWILANGDRQEPGIKTKALPLHIIGVWGSVEREGLVNTYHEVFKNEYLQPQGVINAWSERPLFKLQDLCRQQTFLAAYPENNLSVPELVALPNIEKPKIVYHQLWRCRCGHEFYTLAPTCTIWSKILAFLLWPKIECESCGKNEAARVRLVPKSI